jgi:hypothetical protein
MHFRRSMGEPPMPLEIDRYSKVKTAEGKPALAASCQWHPRRKQGDVCVAPTFRGVFS